MKNSHQSTHHTVTITLSTGRPSELLFNEITSNRTDVIDALQSSGSESRCCLLLLAQFRTNFINKLLFNFHKLEWFDGDVSDISFSWLLRSKYWKRNVSHSSERVSDQFDRCYEWFKVSLLLYELLSLPSSHSDSNFQVHTTLSECHSL